jgi:PST family polysaccharide transporter
MHHRQRFALLTSTQRINEDLRASSIRAAAFTWAVGGADFVFRLAATAVLARLIVPEHFGLVMMTAAVMAVADQFGDFGLSTVTVQRGDITHDQVSNLFWINAAVGTTMALIVCVISPLVSLFYREPRLTVITCVLATNFIWGGLMVQHQALLTRQLKLSHTSGIRLTSAVLSTVLAIFLAWKGWGYWALVWREVARSALLTVGMWVCCPWIPSLPSSHTSVRGLLRFGAELSAANILGSMSSGVDRFLIGRFWGATPTGMYRQAYQLLEAPMAQLLGPLYSVSQPGLSVLQTDSSRYARYYLRALVLVSAATMPVSLFAAVYAKEITRIVLGTKWADAASILMILSIGTFIKEAVGSAAWVPITCGRSRSYLVTTVMHNATVIPLMLIGVHWGAVGVAIASVLATYVLAFPKLYITLNGSFVSVGMFLGALVQPAAASLVMALILVLIRFMLSSIGALGSTVVGALAAAVVFPAAWLLIPGGKHQLSVFVADLASVMPGKASKMSRVQPVVLGR